MIGQIRDTCRTDEHARKRWQLNERVAGQLQRLADYLTVGGYEPSHATHYRRLAATVVGLDESLETLRHEGRLKRLRGVGPGLQGLLTELVDTGTCAKWQEWTRRVPVSVLDLLDIPGIGVKTVRVLYLELGIDGLPALRRAIEAGWLDTVPGLGSKTVTRLRRHLEARDRGEV